MVKLYPHTLNGTITGNAVQDAETGDWIQGAQTSFSIKCRAESEDAIGFVNEKDGVKIDYSWVVYMTRSVPAIQIGTVVTVSGEGGIFLKDTVKRFSRGQLNARVWL